MSFRERAIATAGVVVVFALMGAMLLLGLNGRMRIALERPTTLLALSLPSGPPPVVRIPVPTTRRSAARKAPAPANLRNEPTDIVAPPPVIRPTPSLVVVAPIAGSGAAPSAGAGDRPGAGTGAGGLGEGRGAGGDADEGDYVPPRLTRGRLKFSDLPPNLRGVALGVVAIRYRVQADGRVTDCVVTASSGSRELDDVTCQLVEKRFRYAPSRAPDGRPVGSIVEDTYGWRVDRLDEQPHD